MVTIGMNYEVREGKGEQFEKVFGGVLAVMNATEGHTHSSLFRDVFEINRYIIVSEWADESAFNAFTTSEKFTRIVDWGREDILASPPRHEIYRSEKRRRGGRQCPVHHADVP